MHTDLPAREHQKTIAGVPCSLAYAVMLAVGFMFFTAWNQSHWWRLKDDYVFGWLVPFFVAYVLYERWPQVVTASRAGGACAGSARGGLVRLAAWLGVAGGAVSYVLGALLLAATGASYPASLALSLGTAGVSLGLITLIADADGADGWAVGRLFVFPACVWLVSAPMVSVVENALSVLLLGKVIGVVFFVFESLGLAIEQQGNVLVLPTGEVGVAEACSGIRSLMGCVFAGSFLGAVFFEQLWKKVALLLAAAGFALLMNLVRSLLLTGWAYRYGPESIEGRFHDWTGLGVIGVTTLGLLALTQVLSWKVRVRFAGKG
jgi:exosortase